MLTNRNNIQNRYFRLLRFVDLCVERLTQLIRSYVEQMSLSPQHKPISWPEISPHEAGLGDEHEDGDTPFRDSLDYSNSSLMASGSLGKDIQQSLRSAREGESKESLEGIARKEKGSHQPVVTTDFTTGVVTYRGGRGGTDALDSTNMMHVFVTGQKKAATFSIAKALGPDVMIHELMFTDEQVLVPVHWHLHYCY